MTTLKVIQIVPGISEESSGTTYAVTHLSDSLIRHGQDVTLVALDWGPIPSTYSFLKTFPLGWGPRKLGRSPDMKRWLMDQAASDNIDILHNNGMWQMNAIYPGWVARKSNIILVISPHGALSNRAMQHGSWAKKLFWPILQRPVLEAATCFHATAESEYEDIRQMGFRQPVAIIPNGVDIPAFHQKSESYPRTLLFLGRVHPIKGLDMLLPAWRVIQDRFPEWRLIIVGSDDGYHGSSGYLDKMRKLACELCLKRTEFVGKLCGTKKVRAYQQADLFVLPSYTENFGMTVAEALAVGTPAIVTKGAPWAGLATRGAGWWIDIGQDHLVDCLEDALNRSHSDLVKMGRRGRNWMEAEYSWIHIGQRMSMTYNWLVRNTSAAPEWVRLD